MIEVIKTRTEEELLKKLNATKKNILAIIQKTDGTWVVFVDEGYAKGQVRKSFLTSNNKSNSPAPPFVPTEKLLQKMADEDVTPAQIKILKKLGVDEDEIGRMSKLDAYYLIKNTRKENI